MVVVIAAAAAAVVVVVVVIVVVVVVVVVVSVIKSDNGLLRSHVCIFGLFCAHVMKFLVPCFKMHVLIYD